MLLFRVRIDALDPTFGTQRHEAPAKGLARAKVDQDRQVVWPDHDVLGVDVVVREPKRVEMGHSRLHRTHESALFDVSTLPDVFQKRTLVFVHDKARDAAPPHPYTMVPDDVRVWVLRETLHDAGLAQEKARQKAVPVVRFLVGKEFVHGHVGTLDEASVLLVSLRCKGQLDAEGQVGEDNVVGNRLQRAAEVLHAGFVSGFGELPEESGVIAGEYVECDVLECARLWVSGFHDGV